MRLTWKLTYGIECNQPAICCSQWKNRTQYLRHSCSRHSAYLPFTSCTMASQKHSVFVSGVTGNIGGAVAKLLREQHGLDGTSSPQFAIPILLEQRLWQPLVCNFFQAAGTIFPLWWMPCLASTSCLSAQPHMLRIQAWSRSTPSILCALLSPWAASSRLSYVHRSVSSLTRKGTRRITVHSSTRS